jgi:hypothetical protein
MWNQHQKCIVIWLTLLNSPIMKFDFASNHLTSENVYHQKFCKKSKNIKISFYWFWKYFYNRIINLTLQTNKAKKMPIIWGIICRSSAIFHRVIGFLRKSQILDEGIQGENSWFLEIDFMIKYDETK